MIGTGRSRKPPCLCCPLRIRPTLSRKSAPRPGCFPRLLDGGTEVAAIEQLLTVRFGALQADLTVLLLGVAQEKEFSRLRTNLETFNPFWNTDPYSQEMNFYRGHDAIRQRLARQAGK